MPEVFNIWDSVGAKGEITPLVAIGTQGQDLWAETPVTNAKPGRSSIPGAKPLPPRGFFAETASALGQGVTSTMGAIGATAEMFGVPGGETARNYWERRGQDDAWRRPDYLTQGDVLSNPERLVDWRWWVRSLGENAPNMAAMMLPGVAAARGAEALAWGAKAIRAAGLAGAYAGSFTLEAGGAYSQAKQDMEQAGTFDADTIERLATIEGLTAGTANALIELLPFDNLFLKQVGADKILKRIARQTFLEGSTESAQEAVNVFVEKLGHKPDQTFSGQAGRILEAGVVGGAMGGVAGGTVGTLEHRRSVQGYNALADQLGVKEDVAAWKEAGMPDADIAQKIVAISERLQQTKANTNLEAPLTSASEIKDVAAKIEFPKLDAEEAATMVSFLLYGDGAFTPAAGPVARVAGQAKRGVLGMFGMKERTTPETTADDNSPLTAGATQGKDIAVKKPLAEIQGQAKQAEARKKGETLFDNVMNDLNQEDQSRMEEARQAELARQAQADAADQTGQALPEMVAAPGSLDQNTAFAPETGDLVQNIAAGNIEGFSFPEHFSPMDLNGLWDNLYTISEDIATRNQPTIKSLQQEREQLKSDRSKEAAARKKQISDEVMRLESESQIVQVHAENAWGVAQDDMADRAVNQLKAEGIEADRDTVYDAIATLSDGRQNEQGWNQPLLQQVVDYIKEETSSGAQLETRSDRQILDDQVKEYRSAGHNINDNGVYLEPERIVIPFSKNTGRTGSIDIAEGADGSFRIGAHISKNYGDSAGGGFAPSIREKEYATRDQAIQAGIEWINKGITGADAKTEKAKTELAQFSKSILSGPVQAADLSQNTGKGEKNARKKSAVDLAAGRSGEKVAAETTKQPWEMTKDEYAKQAIDSGAWEEYEKRHWLYTKAQNASTPALKHSWEQDISKATQKYYADTHKTIVQQALSEDNLVPESVLADYPDLKITKDKAAGAIVEPGASQAAATETQTGKEVAKQPWEMTKEEYRQQDPKYVAALAGMTAANAGLGSGKWQHAGARLKRVEIAKNRFFKASDNSEKVHRETIRQALAEGKTIPEEVLNDYPELQTTKINVGDIVTDGLIRGRVLGEAIIGKNNAGYRIELLTGREKGKESFISKIFAELVPAAKSDVKTSVTDLTAEVEQMSIADLEALYDEVDLEAQGTEKAIAEKRAKIKAVAGLGKGYKVGTQPTVKSLDAILKDAAAAGVKGADEAFKGLYELFGGGSLKSFPGGFDADTYAKAKPHFEAAFANFQEAGKGVRDFFTFAREKFGEKIKPYLMQFMKDKKGITTAETPAATDETIHAKDKTIASADEAAPVNLDGNTGKGEKNARRKLTEQEKADKAAKEKAAEAKKAHKATLGDFQNVGYVYDPEKLNQKIKDKSPKSAAKIILDEMVPGKVWNVGFPEATTPGTVRMHGLMQKYFHTFKDYLAESPDRLRYQGRSSQKIEERIERWMERAGQIDQLKGWADEYGKTIQPIIDAFAGQTSIVNVIGRLQETLFPGVRRADGSWPPYNDIPATDRPKLLQNREFTTRPNGFYDFLTEKWQTLLADENDILLSEIDIHKRDRNKEVVRVGLPDYRTDIDLKKTEDFQQPFGFNGVGFGEEGWINQEERNRVIPAAYDAFQDLAATIGAPEKGMSIGGDLAVQFANLGHKAKGAAAAYFPTVKTINFTRDNGDGTMAHEWGHGLHHLASPKAIEEINSIISTFYHVYDFDAGARLVDDLLAKDSIFLKRMVSNKKQVRIEAVKKEVTSSFEGTVRKETDYYKTAKEMDTEYTARDKEMWARAFEAYVYDTLPGKNNYLVSDFVQAGRVGGKAGVGTKLVYPAGKEREAFNATIKHFLEGLQWDENGKPYLKEDYVSIEKANELLLQLQLQFLLSTVEDRYQAIWASEPSKDGYFWYRYDETAFGPMMQPDGYVGYDKTFTSEGQNGTGAVSYLTQLHPDVILDHKLSNIRYEGEKPTYISEGGEGNVNLREDGTEALDEVPAGTGRGAQEVGHVREGDRASSGDGSGGTRETGKQRSTSRSGEGDSAEGVHPAPAGNYRITDLTLTDPKSTSVRFTDNLGAVKVLKLVEAEDRAPTQSEKDILARYSGWGGMAELFAWDPSKAWKGRAELIKAELDDKEIHGAESSSTSSYYTPVPVGQFMWKLAQRLGFEKGVVLDPATGGNGLFMGAMPHDLAQSTALQGIEMDPLSARIAAKLYGLAVIENKSFQEVKKPSNRYDLTITNVPFENITPTDLKHNKGGHKLHNFYINKMIDLTAPGALSMMISTSNTLDTVGTHLTEYAGKADLVGAIRLPSGIFSATNVTTDILVFRKKIEGSKFTGISTAEWTTAGKDQSTGLTINNYFLNHPEMVAGKLEKATGRYGDESLRVAPEGDLQTTLARLAAAFPAKIVEREAVREVKTIDDLISAPGTVKEGGFYLNDKDEICLKVHGEEEKFATATASDQKRAAIAKGFVHILDQVRTVLRAQKTEIATDVIKAEQAKLKKYYEAFVKKHGPVNAPNNYKVYSEATDYAWVVALEEYDPDTGKVTKLADIFTKNITGITSRPDRADTDHDALAMALDEFGYPNLEYMAKLRSSDVATVMAGIADRVVENPETGFLETLDEYLAGNVKRKLAVAREMAQSNPEYSRNVTLLEAAQPADIASHRITARIGASWIQPEHLTQFVQDKMALGNSLTPVFNFNPVSNEWSMTFKGEEQWTGRKGGYTTVKAETDRQIARARRSVEATKVWGTERMDFFKLLQNALEGKRPVVTYYDPSEKKSFMDAVATQAAEDKLQDIQQEFGRWLFNEATRADEAVARFNRLINTSVPMKADGSHLTFPGKSMWMVTPKEQAALGIGSEPTFYPHQPNAVWKYLKNGNLYLAHEVGAGKTVTMALIAMEAKRLRGKKKVLYVTLNDSTMGQALAEIKNLYPLANILPVRVSTETQRKQRALQKIALNEFDIAIMRQQDLDRIALSPEAERVFIEEDIAEMRQVLEEAKQSGARILERDIQEKLHALEEKLKAPSVHDEAKRKNLCFDDLGIDLMIVDEAHQYKNVPYVTRLTRITGLNPPGSPTAQAFFRKTQYLNALYPKHDAIVLASGTALSNSIAEMYNLQRMLQPQEVKRQGVWSFDRWIANYGDMGSQLEFDGARGQYRNITTNRRVVNAGRMLATAYQNVDSVRAKDTPIRRPEIRGGEPQRVKIPPNQYVMDYKQIILDRCLALDADPKEATYEGVPDNMLRIISNMSKVAIDQRLDYHYADTEMQQDSKIAVASKTIFRRWQEEKSHKGVQLVFADLGTPKRFDKFKYKTDEDVAKLTEGQLAIYNEEKLEHENSAVGFNIYDGLKQELIKLGIPRDQIAFIHDADTVNKEKKAANLRTLFKKVNAGDVRVLIGSTSKAGTGVNVQQRVSDIHHLDVWWNFSAWEQRNGRGIRAGNIYTDLGGTYIHNYVTETTVDATRWDKIFAKGKVLNAVLGGDINIDVIDDISDETMSAKMMAAEASGDPLLATQAKLLQQVQSLRFAQAAHLDNVRQSRMELAENPDRIKAREKAIADYQKARGTMDKVTAVKFIGDDRTLVLEKHGKEIAAALEKAVAADAKTWSAEKKNPLLVFGTHTETEVIEQVDGKDKKVKKYTFQPLTAKADITGQTGDPYGRRLLISGDIIASDLNLASIKVDGKTGKVDVEVKANVSRTVTEYLSWLDRGEKEEEGQVTDLKQRAPKLQQVIETPWAKATEIGEKEKALQDVERQMAARGQNAGNPETGVPIERYKSAIPVLEDVADKTDWSLFNGIVYPGRHGDGYPDLAIKKPVDLKEFTQTRTGTLKLNMVSKYNAPDGVSVLEGGTPTSPATKPIAYTTIKSETRFWVPGGIDFVTVDPVQWNLLQRIVGKDGTWHYVSQGMGERYLVHVDALGGRDAFIRTQQQSNIPQGVRDIGEQAAPAQYSLADTSREFEKWFGDKVKKAFKNNNVAKILQEAGPVQAGPLDGGCRILARALQRIERTGKILTLEGKQDKGGWQAEHYGFEFADGGVVDGDGYAATRETWAKRFAKNEDLTRPYRVTEGELPSKDIPADARTEKDLAAALQKHLGGEKYAEGWDSTGTDTPRAGILGDVALGEMVRDLAKTVKGIEIVQQDGENGPVMIRTKSGKFAFIKAVNQANPDEIQLSIGYGSHDKSNVAGLFQPGYLGKERVGLISLIQNQAGLWTLTHEFTHFLEDIGAISNADKLVVNNKVASLMAKDAKYHELMQDRSAEERRADWIGKSLAGIYDAKTVTGKILEKIKGIIDRIVNALGIRTASGVVRDIKSGKFHDQGGIPGTKSTGIQYALSDKAEQISAGVVTKAGTRIGQGVAAMVGRVSPGAQAALPIIKQHWQEFWRPFSTVKDGDKLLAERYRAMGNVAKAVRFIEEIHNKLDSFPDAVKKDMFWFLNGDIPIENLPEDARETAKMLQRRTEIIGEMLVDRGILKEGQFEKYRGKYIHYMYAKHIMGEDKPIFLTSTGKLNLTYTKSRNPNLTLQQRKELGLIEDASVAVPTGMGKALTDIAKFDYLATIAENPDWVWQPSVVKVAIGKPLSTPVKGRTRRNVTMGIGKLVEEFKVYDKMVAKHPTPEVAAIHKILQDALAKAEEDSQNMPGNFVQLPTSKTYGPLAGMYVQKPIADDLQPVMDIMADRGRLMNAILEVERVGMSTFKMGKVALNFPTAFRNVVSNVIQMNMRGRSLKDIPGDIIRSLESMKAKDAYYQEAQGMGLFSSNWFVTEINDVLNEFRKVKGGRWDQIMMALRNVAKYYGKIDDVSKLAIFREQREAGKSVDEATLEAMKWGMDYSLTSRSIKGLRQTIMPFATYQYKIAPLIAESLKKRPWVLAKYGLIYGAAKALAMSLHGLDDHDWEDLEKQLPAYIKKSGSMMILPWKTDRDQWQWVNLEYFFPWGNYLAIARDMKAADLGESLRDLGLSNPFLSMFYTGLSAREDQPPLHSYFGTPIYNQLDSAPVKAAKMLEFMANTWVPSMLTRQGAIGYAGKALVGSEDRWGREVTAGQALGRWFGLNIVSVSPEQTRAQASVRIQDLHKEMARIEADPSYDESDKAAFKTRMNEQLAHVAVEAPAAVLPITKGKGKDPVYDALLGLAERGALTSGPPSRAIEIAGIPFKMTMAQYKDYLERSSEIARQRLSPLVSSPAWDKMSDHRKAETVAGIVTHARKGVRQKIKGEVAVTNRDKIIEEKRKAAQ